MCVGPVSKVHFNMFRPLRDQLEQDPLHSQQVAIFMEVCSIQWGLLA